MSKSSSSPPSSSSLLLLMIDNLHVQITNLSSIKRIGWIINVANLFHTLHKGFKCAAVIVLPDFHPLLYVSIIYLIKVRFFSLLYGCFDELNTHKRNDVA